MTVKEASSCYHGGAFFDAIGREFNNLHRISEVINADVLDAWFQPSPKVLEAVQANLEWAVRTSPPTECEGLIDAISRHRGIPTESVLPGGGSSNLIFSVIPRLVNRASIALILDPTYGEYAFLLENAIKCRVDKFKLIRNDLYAVDVERLESRIGRGYDLVVIVNPNNPSGRHIPRREMEEMLSRVPGDTVIWIDETYIDYVGKEESLEPFASEHPNVIICKSMSKAYALSGLRVGYLCGHPSTIGDFKSFNPPWAVGLPGQIAGVNAMADYAYYSEQYRRTHSLRDKLRDALLGIAEFEIVPGMANYLMCHLPYDAPDTESVMERCRSQGLFLRDPAATSQRLGSRCLRITVKDRETNRKMVKILQQALSDSH